jgi:hypothetical protein
VRRILSPLVKRVEKTTQLWPVTGVQPPGLGAMGKRSEAELARDVQSGPGPRANFVRPWHPCLQVPRSASNVNRSANPAPDDHGREARTSFPVSHRCHDTSVRSARNASLFPALPLAVASRSWHRAPFALDREEHPSEQTRRLANLYLDSTSRAGSRTKSSCRPGC